MGIDTVRLWLPLQSDEAAHLQGRLSVEREVLDRRTGEVSTLGSLGPLSYCLKPDGLRVTGSLHKWVHGTNATEAGRKEVRLALEGLSDTVGLDMGQAQVTRLDIAYNLPVTQPPDSYFDGFGTPSRMTRNQTGTTLYLGNRLRVLVLYDKAKELAAKGVELPPVYSLGPMLRAELRYMGRVARQLKIPELRASHLHHEGHYTHLVGRWKKAFLSLPTVPRFMLSTEAPLQGAKDLVERLAARALAHMTPHEIEHLLAGLPRKTRSDVKAKLAALGRKPHLTAPDERRAEFDRKVREAAEFCR
ncbi:MAG: phage/plasmid replication protein [Bacteroidia bacterium]|nr:phage/plasmid replication protein [Bacteroidia bacterium]